MNEQSPQSNRPTYDHAAHLEAIRVRQAEQDSQMERQLDTEELHAQLGRVGLSRLLHPIRALTVIKRQYTGEYDPNKAHPSNSTEGGLRNPFTEDPLEEKRRQRAEKRSREEERVKLRDPFNMDEEDKRAEAWRKAGEARRATLRKPFEND